MKVLKRPAAHPKKGKARERNKQLAKQYMRTNPIPPLYHPNPKIVFGFVCVWSLYCIGKCLYLDFASQLHFTMEHYEKVSKWTFAKWIKVIAQFNYQSIIAQFNYQSIPIFFCIMFHNEYAFLGVSLPPVRHPNLLSSCSWSGTGRRERKKDAQRRRSS